jgi:signal transduction histidine kinase/ActR/RegA family two-component response regulator
VRQQPPLPERRLMLHGELLQVLGDALLRENHRTRQHEDALAKLRSAAAAKDEFLAVLSHELRTPLAPIAGWASVLKKTESLDEAHRGAAAIERNAFLQSRMVDELLDMNRIAYGAMKLDLEILDLSASIRAAVEASAHDSVKKGIRLELTETGEPLYVEGDAGRLQQIFTNILTNAVKFTPAGGGIRVSLRREAESALIVVADTGKGITPEFLPYVFDIFRQQERGTDRSHEGLGIGLSLVKKLTELHKGTVNVSSAGRGRGTEVTLRLPLADVFVEAQDAAAPLTVTLTGLSVLVVEDADDARESLRNLLQLLGAEVRTARDGQEALDMMLRGPSPDVVLCDLLMPHLDGFEFVRELRSRLLSACPPVIAMSGLASETSRERASRAGFEGHLKKPFNEAGLVSAVQRALAGRQRELH